MNRRIEAKWAKFIMRHLCLTNFFYHLLSVVLFWSGPILFLITFNWYYWILYMLSGPVGSIGHIIGSDSRIDLREAVSSPLAAMMATYMVVRVVTGQYQKDIRWAKEYYERTGLSSPRRAVKT